MIYYKTIIAPIILFAGISLLILAIPRFTASINQAPVNNFFASINDSQRIPKIDEIPRYIALTEATLLKHETSEYWQDLAVLWLHQAQIQGSISSQSQRSISFAEHAARQSLSLMPANSFLFYQLAVIATMAKKSESEIARLLMMSVMSSPYEPGFMLHRLDFCLRYFAALEHHDYSYLVDQVLSVWGHSQQQFVSLLQYRKSYLPSLKILLVDDHSEVFNEILLTIKNV